MSDLGAMALVALPFVVSPGASFSLVLAHTLAGERGAATRVAAGTAAGLGLLALVVALSGLGDALARHPVAGAVVALAGGAVLLVIAVRTVCAGVALLRLRGEARPSGERPPHLGRWSFLVLVTNPKALTLYAVVVPTLAGLDLDGVPLYLSFALVHATLVGLWLAAVGWAARHLPAARSPRVRAVLMMATGAALALVAATTALTGLR